MTAASDLLFHHTGHVAVIEFNRPAKLNAMTPEMAEAMIAAVAQCNADPDIRCVILTGSGTRAFCVGSDIKELDRYDSPWEFRNRPEYCDALRALRKPVIAAVNGYAFGGGLEMAMSCDIRLAADSASFAAPEIKLGWIGGGGMVVHLTHSIGPSNAAKMVLTGDPIDAATACSWGLVSDVCPGADLRERAMDLARTIASRAPVAAATFKTNLRAAMSLPLAEAVAYERDLQTICLATEDAAEGRKAFAEKRAPAFRGR
ncbi:enoyl-CoA hydratase/isomerase family protein [Tabrizicola oligotrophica]|uniref:Enoyl-CoA hydratase/isomerase family protein n=1 Tax=Tabrizicola oligotrophica TaxID=2710650 RepID=A0A6M0QYE5_9RHOB|nr:enoyl-CoA hydratase/isomerase family protein [Tabrizicola oligotrophica]NEY91833.1 enoyl-CoA hydratase/isomerase family protein [Tabrizicola oligotrophica]